MSLIENYRDAIMDKIDEEIKSIDCTAIEKEAKAQRLGLIIARMIVEDEFFNVEKKTK